MGLTTNPEEARNSGTRPDGQQNKYCVLSDEERAKGFVRPVHREYTHLKCGTVTTMGLALCETYARDPSFYGGTFCCHCGKHFPLIEADPADPTNPAKNRRAFHWPDGTGVGE